MGVVGRVGTMDKGLRVLPLLAFMYCAPDLSEQRACSGLVLLMWLICASVHPLRLASSLLTMCPITRDAGFTRRVPG